MDILSDNLLPTHNMIESVVSIMKEGLLVLNSSDRIEMYNGTSLKLLGLSASQELKGKHIRDLYVYSLGAENFIRFTELNTHLDSWQNTFVCTDGRSFIASSERLQIPGTEGDSFLKVILLRDITEQKLAEQKLAEYTRKLEKSNKALDQFAYIVSHDLKAPLRAINNLSSWLQEDLAPSLSEDNKSNLTMLRGRVIRLESLINGILEYSKIGRRHVASELVDIHTLLVEVAETLYPPSHIRIEIGRQMPVLEAPKILLFQIFSNLIGNAIKYNDKPAGLVKIACLEKEEDYEFLVEDNGPGISSEFFETIFVIFQTLQSRDKFESTGIGLTIVKRIIEESGGKIWVESEVGKGSKFIFSWPKHQRNNDNLNFHTT